MYLLFLVRPMSSQLQLQAAALASAEADETLHALEALKPWQ